MVQFSFMGNTYTIETTETTETTYSSVEQVSRM